jgi:hypothetical protein
MSSAVLPAQIRTGCAIALAKKYERAPHASHESDPIAPWNRDVEHIAAAKRRDEVMESRSERVEVIDA